MTDHPALKHCSDRSSTCSSCCTKLINFNVKIGQNPILENINLHIHCGELTALIGPNGAGKTTLFRAMLGELQYTGQLHFIHSGNQSSSTPKIGYVPQKLDFDSSSPVSVLDLFYASTLKPAVLLGYPASITEGARKALAETCADNLINRKLGELSGGELQRVLLALALFPVPDLLLLDEPVSGIDAAGTMLFYKTASELRTRYDLSIILVSHDLKNAAHFADRMIFLNKKILCDGSPASTLSDPVVRRTFGLDLYEPYRENQ